MRILIVDDESAVRRLLRAFLEKEGYEVVEASGVTSARAAVSSGDVDVVITDQVMPDGAGLEVLADCRERDRAIPVIFLTGAATVELAVDAMRSGAFDFLPKPFQRDQVIGVVRRAVERTELVRENERLRGQVRRLVGSGELIGNSAGMREVRELVERFAPTDATVLILGETGSGKELVARAIHQSSRRADRIFLPVNCAGFSETLLESELFGHERGAFTGADRPRAGLFEAAHGGTLFLDEAGDMSLPLQAKLLRVLMTGEMLRVGATLPKRVDVRIVAATHRDLEQRVREGSFRQDLYYRLAVLPLRVPPLRDRPEDIPCSSRSSWRPSPVRSSARRPPFLPWRSPSSPAMTFRETSASCATSWSAPSSCPAEDSSNPWTCRCRARVSTPRPSAATCSSSGSRRSRSPWSCATSWTRSRGN